MKEASLKRSHMFLFYLYDIPQIGKSMETESMLVVSRGEENGLGEQMLKNMGFLAG